MDTEKIRLLLKAIDDGSLSKTAQEAGYTTSGVSRSLSSLEDEIGIKLLTRGKKGVTPTSECTMLLKELKEIVRNEEIIRNRISEIKGIETGYLRVGIFNNLYYTKLSGIIYRFIARYPGINVEITESPSSLLAMKLNSGELDVCIMSKRDNVRNIRKIIADDIRIWVPKDHPSIKNGAYALKDLEKDRYINIYPGFETNNAILLKNHKINPNTVYNTNDIFAAYSMVEANLGVALIDGSLSEAFSGNVVTLELDITLETDIVMATMAEDEKTSAVRRFESYFMKEYHSDQNQP